MPDSNDEQKPCGRPLSTLALSFAASLDNVFELSPDLDHLSKSVASKRRSVSIQKSELEVLQAKIREAEERLKLQQPGSARIEYRKKQSTSPRVARKPALEAISSTDSDEDSESSDSDTEEDEGPEKDSVSEQEEEDEPEEKPKVLPVRQRAASRVSLPPSQKKAQIQSPGKGPAGRSAHRKNVPSRGKA